MTPGPLPRPTVLEGAPVHATASPLDPSVRWPGATVGPHQHLLGGRLVPWHSVLRVESAGGDAVFACRDCSYESPNPFSVRSHRNSHAKRKPASPRPADGLAAVRALLNGEDHPDVAYWRGRAMVAEAALSKIRKAAS